MEIKPVKNTDTPKYPLKDEVREDILKKSVPKRWAGSPAAKIALGTLAAVSLAGCTLPTGGAPMTASATYEGSYLTNTPANTPDTSVYGGVPMPAKINVAPLFAHGEGRGAYGCDMVMSPAYISELEALTIINEIAKEYGLEFTNKDTTKFSNVLRPVTEIAPPMPDNTVPDVDVFITLKSDFFDSQHGVAIEYITADDVKAWSAGTTQALIETYDVKDAAAQMSESLEDAKPVDGCYTAGVLYDPCELIEPEKITVEEAEAQSKVKAEEELKAQATDFFNWLKTQGII